MNLKPLNAHASTVLGSWVALFPDLIPHNDIVTLFKDKSKWMGKGKAKDTLIAAEDDSVVLDVDNVLPSA